MSQDVVTIKDVAHELGVKTTDLMLFINENPDLFVTEEVWKYKKVKYDANICGMKVKQSEVVKDKVVGLGIRDVYMSPAENWRTPEWLDEQIEKYRKTIWVSQWNNYGTIEGTYVREDTDEKDRMRSHLWRNTHEKMEKIKDLLFETTFYYGGFCDYSTTYIATAIDGHGIDILRKDGWNVILC